MEDVLWAVSFPAKELHLVFWNDEDTKYQRSFTDKRIWVIV